MKKLTRVQRLINIKIAKAYRTVSNDALRIITGLTAIHVKIKETAELYKIVRGNRHKNLPIDNNKLPKQWLHPAARIITTDDETDDPTPINIYTDGSKSEQGLESREWKTRFRWVKAHAGTSGNSLVDKLAKKASSKTDLPISYNRVPKSVIKRDLENTSVEI
jgi:hypothetical protein